MLRLNGCGKSTLLAAIGYRELPIPEHKDIFHLSREIDASDMSSLDAVINCDEEELKLEREVEVLAAQEDGGGEALDRKSLPALVPMLLETLLNQEEDQDQDNTVCNLSMAGGTCLGLVARTVGDAIAPLVMPSVEQNILNPDLRRAASALENRSHFQWADLAVLHL